MSRRFQALVTMLVGATIAGVGLYWSVGEACCSGIPTLVALGFAAFGIALLGLGFWAQWPSAREPGILRRNPLYATILAIAAGTALLAHEVYGVRRERVLPMVWEEAGGAVVLRYESHPDTFHLVEERELADYLRSLPDRRVEATVQLVYVFGSRRSVQIVRVGELARPQGFRVTSGVRGAGGGSTPWD